MNPFYCFMVLLMMSICDASKSNIEHQKLKVKKPLKSIKSPDGDIIDCVLISHQPAFDHPLLKNHTIQMKPNYYPEGISSADDTKTSNSNPHGADDSSKPITQLWHLNGRCPKGTVPIRRIKQEDVIRASSINSFGRKWKNRFSQLPPATIVNGVAHEYAITSTETSNYYGAKAIINVWNPKVQEQKEFSLAQIWVVGGPRSNLNTIEVGWNVAPFLYGDSNTRLFVFWTGDGYHYTGCYNLRCPGFVQISNNMAVGGSISPSSDYQGSQQEITILVWKDAKQDAWWLKYGDETIGYWPNSLFQYLSESASMVQWGGEVVNTEPGGQHTTTQMGSGHFAEEGLKAAGYFRNLEVVDGSNTLRPPSGVTPFADEPNCYTISLQQNNDWGNYFYFGGPGRNPKCP